MIDRRTLTKRAAALGAGLGLSHADRSLTPLARAQDAATPQAAESPPTLELINGQWFDGNGFVPVTMYTQGGVFREQAPAVIDETIDLEGNFVIAPLGDAHIHWLAGPGTEEFFAAAIARVLDAGEFYVLDLGGIPKFSPLLDPLVDSPTSVDFVTAQQRWTGLHGWPEFVYTAAAQAGILALPPDEFEGGAYFQVESEADIDRAWPRFLEGHPGIVKIDVLWSEEYAKRANDPASVSQHGINPALIPALVERAHADGLRVIAHVTTAPDFHNALYAGVDAIAHIPVGEIIFVANPNGGLPIRTFNTSQNYRFVIAEDDARYAGEHQIPVCTTLIRVDHTRASDPDAVRLVEEEVVRPNLRMLRKYNVPVLLGSDEATPVLEEVIYLAQLGVYSPLEVLKRATEATPQFIFPERKIGLLRDGYEASFLVYSGDPLAYLAGERPEFQVDMPNPEPPVTLTMRYKQGYPITLTAEASASLQRPLPEIACCCYLRSM